MSSSDYPEYQAWETSTRDTIDFKKIYVDIAGDLVAGLLLSQIIYWELPDKNGRSKLRVAKDGEWWIAKRREDWWEEVRIKPKRFDRACTILVKKGIIAKTYGRFNGLRTMHIRIVAEVYIPLWKQALDDISHAVPEKGIASYPKGEDRSSRSGKTEVPDRVRPLTESTTETTTQSTTPPAAERTPTALSEKRKKDQDQSQEQRRDEQSLPNSPSLINAKPPGRRNMMANQSYKPTMEVPIDGGTVIVAVPPRPELPPEIYGAVRSYDQGKEVLVYPEGDSGPEVGEIWLEPEDTQVTCPLCDHAQRWPQSEGQRRKPASLMCQLGEGGPMDGCGAYLIIHAFKRNGSTFTYKLNIPEPHWTVVVDGAKWDTTEDEARLFLANWDEDEKFLLEKFVWAIPMLRLWKRREILIERVNAAFATGMKNRAARQAERDRRPEAPEIFIDEETGEEYVEEPPY